MQMMIVSRILVTPDLLLNRHSHHLGIFICSLRIVFLSKKEVER